MTRDPRFKDLNAQAFSEFDKAGANLGQISHAQTDKTLEWKRDKFDLEHAKFIQRYLVSQKRDSNSIDPHVFRDLNFITNKYIESLGSNEFNALLNSVLNEKLKLDSNTSYQAFITELFVNSIDTSV